MHHNILIVSSAVFRSLKIWIQTSHYFSKIRCPCTCKPVYLFFILGPQWRLWRLTLWLTVWLKKHVHMHVNRKSHVHQPTQLTVLKLVCPVPIIEHIKTFLESYSLSIVEILIVTGSPIRQWWYYMLIIATCCIENLVTFWRFVDIFRIEPFQKAESFTEE